MTFSKIKLFTLLIAFLFMISLSSCSDDDLQTATFSYNFNTGQVAAAFAYTGNHSSDLNATITVTERSDGDSDVTITLNNTMDGVTYRTHAHDMADASVTVNGTPYIESPNADVFASPIEGNGGSASVTKTSTMSFEEITTTYNGFFVVHDPLQDLTTIDPSTYVILGVFAR